MLVASSISDAPEDWTDTGVTVGGVRAQMTAGDIHLGKVSQSSRAPIAGALWLAPGVHRASGRLGDTDATKMAAVIPGATRVTSSAKVALTLPAANTPITAKAVMLVPEMDYGDDGVGVNSAFVVWFERATIVVDTLPGFSPVEDGEDPDMGYEIRVESMQGAAGIGYPAISAPDLNPQGVLFAWQPSLDAITPLVGEGAGTFTRATTATYVDDDGLIQTAISGAARYQDGGILLGPQRTNLIVRSNHGAGWSSSGTPTITTGLADCAGGNNAFSVQDDAGAGYETVNPASVSVTAGLTYTFSIFVKKDASANADTLVALQTTGGMSKIHYLFIDPRTGAIDSTSSPVAPTAIGVEELDSGWYRVWITKTIEASQTGATLLLYPAGRPHALTGPVATTGTARFFGCQAEQGSGPSAYIPTTGTAVTRNADALTNPFTTGLPEEGMTVLWKGIPKATPGTGDMAMTVGVIGSTTDADEFKLSAMGDGTIDYSGPSGVAVVTASGGPTLADGTEDDIVAQVSVSGDTVRTFDGDDTAQSTAAIAATTGHYAADDVISRNTSAIPFILTGMVIVKGILTPAQIRKYLR